MIRLVSSGGLHASGLSLPVARRRLMDLSHEAYVHRGTIEPIPKHLQRLWPDGEHVTVERIMPGCPAPPFYQKLKGYDGTIDRMHRIISILRDHNDRKIDANRGTEPDDGLEYRVLCAITPGRIIDAFLLGRATNFNPEQPVTEMMYQGSRRCSTKISMCQPATGSVEPVATGRGRIFIQTLGQLCPPGY